MNQYKEFKRALGFDILYPDNKPLLERIEDLEQENAQLRIDKKTLESKCCHPKKDPHLLQPKSPNTSDKP